MVRTTSSPTIYVSDRLLLYTALFIFSWAFWRLVCAFASAVFICSSAPFTTAFELLGCQRAQRHCGDDWMLAKVHIKWCESCIDIYCINCSKLCQWKLCCLGGRTVFNVRPQKIISTWIVISDCPSISGWKAVLNCRSVPRREKISSQNLLTNHG